MSEHTLITCDYCGRTGGYGQTRADLATHRWISIESSSGVRDACPTCIVRDRLQAPPVPPRTPPDFLITPTLETVTLRRTVYKPGRPTMAHYRRHNSGRSLCGILPTTAFDPAPGVPVECARCLNALPNVPQRN